MSWKYPRRQAGLWAPSWALAVRARPSHRAHTLGWVQVRTEHERMTVQEVIKEVPVEVTREVVREVEVIKEVPKEVIVEKIIEKEVRVEVPPLIVP